MNILKATKRTTISTGQVNKLRSEGFVPAVLYGGKKNNLNISLKKLHLQNLINTETFMSKVFDLDIDGSSEKALPRDVAYDPISDEPIHIDFMRISKGSKLVIEIPVKFINSEKSPGLKKGGVLRIATPDAKFLYDVSVFDNTYWTWRKHWFENPENITDNLDIKSLKQIDYFIKMIATPKSPYYKNKIVNESKNLEFDKNTYQEIVDSLTTDLTFRYKFPGDHINYWDFKKVKSFGNNSGFTNIIESKHLASVSEIMRRNEFDKKAVMMSLYVDLVK